MLANQTNTTIVCCLICTDQRDKQGYKVLEVKAIIFLSKEDFCGVYRLEVHKTIHVQSPQAISTKKV